MDGAERSKRTTAREVVQNLRNRKFVLLLNQLEAELRVEEERPHQNTSEHQDGSRGSSIKDTREGYVVGEEAIHGILSDKGCSAINERKGLLLLNKAYCEHQLGLMRRALKVSSFSSILKRGSHTFFPLMKNWIAFYLILGTIPFLFKHKWGFSSLLQV